MTSFKFQMSKAKRSAVRWGRAQNGIRNTQCSIAVIVLLMLVACQPAPSVNTPMPITPAPAVATALPRPTETLGIPTTMPATLVPPPTPTIWPTLAITPTPVPVALDKWKLVESQDKSVSFRYPPDWSGRNSTQAITRTLQPIQADMVWLRGPGANDPEFVLMYNWRAFDLAQPATNATAWSSVAGLAKLFLYPDCVATFDAPAPVTLAGQQTMGVKFVVQCDRLYAGYLAGLVHQGVNYGLIVDVPAEAWDAWRPTFETIFASLAFGP